MRCCAYGVFLFLVLVPVCLFAESELGLGYASPYGARNIPVLSIAHETTNWKLTLSTAGVQTRLYYHSTYGVSAYKYWRAGELWGFEVQTGFGGGFFYAERGFRDGDTMPLTRSTDIGFGPALLLQWNFPRTFIKLESTYGLSKIFTTVFAASVQDNTVIAVGLRW